MSPSLSMAAPMHAQWPELTAELHLTGRRSTSMMLDTRQGLYWPGLCRTLRQEVYTAYETRASSGSTDNSPVVEQIMSLRQEQAQLAGYNNAADYLMSNKVRASCHGSSRDLTCIVLLLCNHTAPLLRTGYEERARLYVCADGNTRDSHGTA